jgi:hypothetical protein
LRGKTLERTVARIWTVSWRSCLEGGTLVPHGCRSESRRIWSPGTGGSQFWLFLVHYPSGQLTFLMSNFICDFRMSLES